MWMTVSLPPEKSRAEDKQIQSQITPAVFHGSLFCDSARSLLPMSAEGFGDLIKWGFFGLFQRADGHLRRDRRELIEEFSQGVPACKVVHQVLEWNSRAAQARCSIHNLWVHHDCALGRHCPDYTDCGAAPSVMWRSWWSGGIIGKELRGFHMVRGASRIVLALAAVVFAPAAPVQPDVQEILARVSEAYAHAGVIHIVALDGDETEYELAQRGKKFRVSIRSAGAEGFAVSNGKALTKVLPRAREYMTVWSSADDDESQNLAGADGAAGLHGIVAERLLTRYTRLAAALRNAEIVREDSAHSRSGDIPVWVLRDGGRELWIDRNRYLVVRDAGIDPKTNAEMYTRITRVETGDDVADALFTFKPERGWKRVELLFLPKETPVSLPGAPAADFALPNLDGAVIRLSALRGQVLLINFWATWCQPCRKELPTIEKLRKEFAGAVHVLTVDDEEGENLRAFLEKNRYGFEVLRDADLRVHGIYGARAIPKTIIVDRDGIVRERLRGPHSEAAIRKAIELALKGPVTRD